MFLVDMTFTNFDAITPELTQAHRQHLTKEYEAGHLLFGGRKEPRTGGLILSRHPNKANLIQLLESDPFVMAGAANYQITEFVPVMAADAFSELLTTC